MLKTEGQALARVSEIPSHHVKKALKHLESENTVNSMLNSLSKCFRAFLMDWDVISDTRGPGEVQALVRYCQVTLLTDK